MGRKPMVILRGALALALIALGVAGMPAGAASHRSSGLTIERTFLPTVTPPGYGAIPRAGDYVTHLALNAAAATSTMYAVDDLSPGFVTAYDLKSLRPRSHRAAALDGTVSTVASLPKRGGMLIAVSAGGRGQPTTEVEQVAWSAGRLRVLSRLPTPAAVLGVNQTIVGFGLDPRHGDVFAVSATVANGAYVPGTVQLNQIALANSGGPKKLLWHQPLPGCQLPTAIAPPSPLHLAAPLGVAHGGRTLDVGCAAQGSAGVYKPPTPIGVGMVRLSKATHPRYQGFEIAPYPGDATQYAEGIWFPRQQRMVFQTYNVDNGGGWVVFDGAHNAYVGAVPLSVDAQSAGGDLTHGRLYLLAGYAYEGLRAADVGPTPVDQGHTYPEFSSDHLNEHQNFGRAPFPSPIATDPTHRRLFLLYTNSNQFVVLRDSTPYYSKPALPDPDQNTTDVAEHRGVTDANWSSSGQGYGSIVRQVGGASNLQYNYAPFVVNQSQSGTQQLATSYLSALQLTGGDARASAVTAAPDDGPTSADLAQAGQKWPYQPAACDDSGATHAAHVDSATVECNSAGGSVTASVVGGAAGTGSAPSAADVIVGSTALSAKSTASTGHGTTTTVTSIARGISLLGGKLQIGHIAATATAHAGGRRGTAHTTYSRTLSNVSLAGQRLCANSCDPKELATRINDAFAGRAVVTFPQPDHQLAAGSPGGYQSLVRRDAFGQTEETQLNDQDPDRAEVPGMELTLFEDNTVKSRTVVYLAGVEAEAHYGIYRLSCSTCSTNPASTTKATRQGGTPLATKPDGATPDVDPASPTASSPEAADQPSGIAGVIRHGWQLLTNGLAQFFRLFGVWLLLLAPVYLSARRWLLISRHRQAK